MEKTETNQQLKLLIQIAKELIQEGKQIVFVILVPNISIDAVIILEHWFIKTNHQVLHQF